MDKLSPVLKETFRLLGVKEPDYELLQKAEEIHTHLKKICMPKTLSAGTELILADNSVCIGGYTTESKNLYGLLKNSSYVYVMASTLGYQADRYISELQLKDMSDAVIADACASAMADILCDEEEGRIVASLDESEFMTMRFSPGYGDVPLDMSEAILNILNAQKRAGITMTASSMLLPVKSVTAVIGISDKKQNRFKSCSCCSIRETCIYRKRGDICGTGNK